MSTFEDLKNTAASFIKDNKDTLKQGVEKSGDAIDNATNQQYSEQIDAVQSKANEAIDGLSGDQ